jgi:endonuclease/exonuclease/phosphatase family metal-dependent hydrolase
MPLTITTWNVQNFTPADPAYLAKLAYLTAMLQALNPDVVALQEILDPVALDALAANLHYQHVAAPPDGRGIRVAFLVRQTLAIQAQAPINQWRLPAGLQVGDLNGAGTVQVLAAMPRPSLEITLNYGAGVVDVITTHLKSKLLTFHGAFSTNNETLRAHTAYLALERRSAEATSLREHVTGRLAAGHHVVLLGDLNDGPEAATTQILYGPPGGQPRSYTEAQRPAGAFQRADASDPRRLFNVTKLEQEEGRHWTRRYNGQNELLDHILCSEGLMPRGATGLRRIPGVAIHNEDAPNLLGAHPVVGGVVPDHASVTATFA